MLLQNCRNKFENKNEVLSGGVMIDIRNYKEVIRTPNDDGTERVEIVGCKVTSNGEKFEANLILPRVLEIEEDVVAYCSMDSLEEGLIFTIHIPD